MNLIEKITAPTFTNSSKGLLTLFCIGLFHTVVGVDLTSTEIAIPWLPSINFPNTERLSYLYWIAVSYTVYRYVLHNTLPFRETYFKALCLFLKSSSGKSFINSTIYAKNLNNQVEVINDSKSVPTIRINYFDCDEIENVPLTLELMANFDIIFNKDYTFDKIDYSEDNRYIFDEILIHKEEIRNKWGLSRYVNYNEFNDYDLEPTFISREIKSIWFRLKLGIPTKLKYFNLLASNKDTFDLLVPVVLHLFLFIYCILANC